MYSGVVFVILQSTSYSSTPGTSNETSRLGEFGAHNFTKLDNRMTQGLITESIGLHTWAPSWSRFMLLNHPAIFGKLSPLSLQLRPRTGTSQTGEVVQLNTEVGYPTPQPSVSLISSVYDQKKLKIKMRRVLGFRPLLCPLKEAFPKIVYC